MSARTGKLRGTGTIAFVLVGTVLGSSTLALAQQSLSSQQGRFSAPLTTQVPKEGFSIGPVPGLTTRWHPAPTEAWIPIGTSPKFYCPAGVGTNVIWSGAVETSRNRFGSFAQATLNELGPHTVGVAVLGGGSTLGQNACNLTIVDFPVDSIALSSMSVRADPVVIDEQASPEEINEQTLAYFYGRSIASLQDLGGGAYLTSINREVILSVDVNPPGFAPLVEWRFGGETTYAGMGVDVRHAFSEVGNHELSAGPSSVALGGLLVETYAATITSHTAGDIAPAGVPVVFTAVTDPPGYESSITWLSSTLYGTASPVLGQGPTFTAIFEDTFGPHQDGGVWEWLGVKADNVTFGQDQKTGACCLPQDGCTTATEDDCASKGGVYQGTGSQCGSNPCPLLGVTPEYKYSEQTHAQTEINDGWQQLTCAVGEGDPLGGGLDGAPSGTSQCPPPKPSVCPPPETANSLPVRLFSGEAALRVVDLSVPSRGFPLLWARTYSSRGDFEAGHGHNWDYTYNRRVVTLPNGNASLINGLGREDVYSATGDGSTFVSPAGIFDSLVKNPDGTHTQVHASGMRFEYDVDGYLSSMSDRTGNTSTMERNLFHHLVRIVDTQGRRYDIAYTDGTAALDYNDGTPQQRVASLTDFANRQVVYGYDGNGDLISKRSPVVTGTPNGNDFPSGKTTLYTYTSGFVDERLNHNLTSVVEPLYNFGNDPALSKAAVTLTYSATTDDQDGDFDHVISERWGHDQGGPPSNPATVVGGTSTFSYSIDLVADAEAPANAISRTIETDRNGNERVYYFSDARQTIKVIERTNRSVRPSEGDYVTTYDYDSDGLLVSRTLPRGNGVAFVYDSSNPRRESQGNMLEVRSVSNGIAGGGVDLVTRFTYEPVFNQLRTITDPRAFPAAVVPLDGSGHLDLGDPGVARYTTTYFYDYQEGSGFQTSRGISLAEQIPESLGDLNGATDFDEGNVVKVQLPTIQTSGPNNGDVIFTLRSSNEFGQPLTVTDPEGHVSSSEYFASNGTPGDASDLEGYVHLVTRASGVLDLTTELCYDTVGNVIFVIDPKGQRADLFVNQLNQTVRVESRPHLIPGAAEPRYRSDIFYNENDDVIKTEALNLDETGAAYPHGLIVNEHEYNILHYLVASELDRTLNDGTEAGSVLSEYCYDPNLNPIAQRSPEAVNGNQPDNVVTTRFDERDLLYKVTVGDDDTDPLNTAPGSAVVATVNYDPNRNVLEEIDLLRDVLNPGAPVTVFPGSSAGDLTRYAYDGFDRPVSATDGEGNVAETLYDLASNPLRQTLMGPKDHTSFVPALLNQTDLVFDELNRVVTTDTLHFDTDTGAGVGDGHSISEYGYDLDSKLVRIVDDRSLETTFQWDTADRRVKTVDHLDNEVELTYDDNSNVIQTTQRDASTDLATPMDVFIAQTSYDGNDRPLKSVDPAGDVNEVLYDSRSNVVLTSDAVRGSGHPAGPGNTVSYEYDGLNRLVTTVRHLTDNGRGDGVAIGTITTTQILDDNSRVTGRADDNGHTTTYEYDNLNRLTRILYADGTNRTSAYDVDNRLSQWTDQNGTVCDMTYDGLDRLLARNVTRAAGVVGTTLETFGYDGADRVTFTENDDGMTGSMTCAFRYDSLDQRTSDIQGSLSVDSVFDGVGNRTRCTYPGAFGVGQRVLDCTFDLLNRIQSISDSFGTIASFHYKGSSRLERRTYGSDASPISQLDVAYDSLPRAIDLDHRTGPAASGGAGQLIAQFQYGHDRMHHRIFEKRVHEGNTGDVYAYDSIYRVTCNLQGVDLMSVPAGTEILPEVFASPDALVYQYDGVGNRTTSTETVAGVPTLTSYVQAADDAEVNQYTSVQEGADPPQDHAYDGNGNLTSDVSRTYAYDFKNRLVEVREQGTTATMVAQYAYDAFDRRGMKSLPSGITHYLYDGHECVEERDDLGDLGTVVRQYVWGSELDELLEERTLSAVYHVHENSIGDIAALTNAAGAVVERYNYDAFGKTVVTVDGGTGNEYRYHGARFDSETGFYYMRARYYSPALGRFTQRDPIGVWKDHVNLGNSYSFVGNDATNGIDPMGRAGLLSNETMKILNEGLREISALKEAGKGARAIFKGEINLLKKMNACKDVKDKLENLGDLVRLQETQLDLIYGRLAKRGTLRRIGGFVKRWFFPVTIVVTLVCLPTDLKAHGFEETVKREIPGYSTVRDMDKAFKAQARRISERDSKPLAKSNSGVGPDLAALKQRLAQLKKDEDNTFAAIRKASEKRQRCNDAKQKVWDAGGEVIEDKKDLFKSHWLGEWTYKK